MENQFNTFLLPILCVQRLYNVKQLHSRRQSFRAAYVIAALIPLLLLLTSFTAKAQPETLHLDTSYSGEDIDAFVGYFADTQGNQNLEDIQLNPKVFVPSSQKRFTFNAHTHWHQLKIENTDPNIEQWYFGTGISTAPYLRAYWTDDRTGETSIVSDTLNPTPNSEKKIRYVGYLIPIEIKPGDSGTLIIEYRSMANFQLRLMAFTERDIISRGLKLMLLNGIYAGIISVFAIFFLAQFIVRKTRTLGYYTLFIFSLIAFVAQLNGLGFQVAWGALKQFNSPISTLLGGSIYIWYFLFTANLFQLSKENRKLYYVIMGFCGVISVAAIVGLFIPTDYILSVIVAIGLPWPSIVAIWAIRKNHPSAKMFFIGSCIHCLTTYLFMLGCLGISLGDNSLIFGLATAGQLIDIICFSIAIFYQQNEVRKQYHKQVEQRLNDMHSLSESEQLSAKMLSMSKEKVLKTAATIHDLLQPLASMRLTISSMDPQQKTTTNLKSAVDYADNLLQSVLRSSKVDYHKIHETVNISRLIHSIAQRHYATFELKNIKLRVRCPDIEITCLPIVVNRLVDNLLVNALRYTDHGAVLLSGRQRPGNRFLIQIWDTGPGIPAYKIKKILSPFEQLNQDDIENMGFGLGLFIVKSLCDDAGYELGIRSIENKGTCFSILVTDTNL